MARNAAGRIGRNRLIDQSKSPCDFAPVQRRALRPLTRDQLTASDVRCRPSHPTPRFSVKFQLEKIIATLTQHTQDEVRLTELVRAAQAGDRDAFGRLVERFERAVFAIALRRLGNYTDAQELCQDVFVQALQKLHQLKEPPCFGGWLRSITHRMAINRMVRRRPDLPANPETLNATCVDWRTPLTSVLDRERASQVRAGLARLGDIDRETLTAFYVRGCSLLEMSEEFDAPIGTIKRRLHVARKRMVKQVEELLAV